MIWYSRVEAVLRSVRLRGRNGFGVKCASSLVVVMSVVIALLGLTAGSPAVQAQALAPTPQAAALPAYDGPGLVSGGAECPSPPPHFDALHASPATLQSYGLPARPAAEADVAGWLNDIQHSQRRFCGLGTPAPATGVGAVAAAPQAPQASASQAASGVAPLTSISYRPNPIWSGYEVTNGGYDQVQAQWTTACYRAPEPAHARAQQWVGIGGGRPPLWQAGTETDPTHPSSLWYDEFPTTADVFVGPTFVCGDTFQVLINTGAASSCGSTKSYAKWTDMTQQWYWSVCVAFSPNGTTAEWVDERPSCKLPSGTLTPEPLANFYQNRWSGAYAKSTYDGSSLHPISYWSGAINNFTMEQNSLVLASASGLGSDGASFSVTWDANGSSPCTY